MLKAVLYVPISEVVFCCKIIDYKYFFSYYKVIMEVVREDVFSLYDQMPFTIHYCDYHSCSLSGMPKFI
jgi:hypothetical protein